LLRDAIHSVSFPQGSSNEETQTVARAKIRVDDKTSHGGTVLEGFPEMQCYGQPVAGLGHAVSCPKCSGRHRIAEGVASFSFNGTPIALEGMKTSCGAVLIASQHLDMVELVSGENPMSNDTASSRSSDGSALDEQVIEQWFGLEDEHGNPVKGYKYDLLKDGEMYTRAASFDSGQSAVVNGDSSLQTIMWLDRDSAAKTW
jgi:uncharacterized Zn-binding protein involved in type VI secretion